MASSAARRGGYGGGGGGGRAGSGAHLLSFSYGASNRDQLLDAESDARADRSTIRRGGGGGCGKHHPPSNQHRRSGGGGASTAPHTDPAQQERAAAIQRFQFIVSRDDLGHPALRDAMMAPDAPPPWEIVKFVVVRCPLDDFACPICLEQPVAAVASVTCGHVYCLKCVFSLAIHGWDKERLKQAGASPPPPQPVVASAPAVNPDGPFIDGLTDRALGQYVRGGCPMCHKTMSLRELVPALHVPVAPLRSGDKVTFVPVRATLPMPIAVYGTPGADCCRINVEADETLAWATQQAFELGDEADAAIQGIAAAELGLEMAIVNEAARLAAEEEGRPEHQKSANTAAALFASTRALRPQEECENVKEARLGIRAAKIEAEAVRLARSFWIAFVEAASNAADAGPLTAADLDVFSLYGGQVAPSPPGTPARAHSGDFSKAHSSSSSSCHNMGRQTSTTSVGGSGGGGGRKPPSSATAVVSLGEPCNEHWTFRAGSGAQVFLHPLVTRLVIESALERKGYTTTTTTTMTTVAATESLPAPVCPGGPSSVPSGGFGEDVHYDTAATCPAYGAAVVAASASTPPPLLTAADLPRSITVKVAEIEEVEQTRQSRHRDKAHALLPVGGRFSLVFPEAMPESTTRDVRQRHKKAFDARARRRHDKTRRETDEETRARQREDERARRRNEADPTRHVSAIPAAQYYVTGDDGFETFEIPPDLSESPEVVATTTPGAPPPAVVSPPSGPRAAAAAWAPKNRNLLAEDDSAPSLLGPASAGDDTTTTTPSSTAAPPPKKWGAKPQPAPTPTSRDKVNPWGAPPSSSSSAAAAAKKRPPPTQ